MIFTVHFWLTKESVSSENQRSQRENTSTALYFSQFKQNPAVVEHLENKVYVVEERVSSALLKDEDIHIRIAGVTNHLHWSCLPAQCWLMIWPRTSLLPIPSPPCHCSDADLGGISELVKC